jgi:hypothetical protein
MRCRQKNTTIWEPVPFWWAPPPVKPAIYTSAAPERPKCREVLKVRPDDAFLLIRGERYDRTALARCVRLATQNAYLTLQSALAESEDNHSKAPAAVGANDG